MSNILYLYDNLLDSAILTASSEATGFPAENLQNPFRSKVWRTAGTTPGAATLVIDHGSAKDVNAIALCGYSWATAPGLLVVEFNDTDVWTNPAATETLTWNAPTTPGGNKGSIILKMSSTRTYRYNRLRVAAASGVTLTADTTGGAIYITAQNSLATSAWLNAYATAFDTFSSSGSTTFTASDASGETGIRVRVPVTLTQGKRYVIAFTPTFSGATVTHIYFATDAYAGVGRFIALNPSMSTTVPYVVDAIYTGTTATSIMLIINAAAGATFSIAGFVVRENNGLAFGTDSFSMVWKGALPDYTPTAVQYLIASGSGNSGISLNIDASTGKMALRIVSTIYRSSVAPTLTDGSVAELGFVVTVGAVNTTVVFYCNGVAVGTTQSAANPGTASSGGLYFNIMSSYAKSYKYAVTNLSKIIAFNRALTAAEMLALYTNNDIDYKDKYGSQTPTYISNFTAGEDSWTAGDAAGATLTGNTDGINGSDDWLKIERTGASGRLDIFRNATLTSGKLSHVRITIYNHAASDIAYFMISFDGTNNSEVIAVAPGSEVTTTLHIASAGSTTPLRIMPCSSAGAHDTTIATGTIYYVKNIFLYRSGATLELGVEGINSTDWQDSSTNNLDAAYPATGYTVNGAADWDLGRMFIGEYFEPAENYGRDYEEAVVDPSLLSQTIGGQDHADEIEKCRVVNCQGVLKTQAEWVLYQAMIAEVGRFKPLFIAFDYDNDAAERTLYGKFAEIPSVSRSVLFEFNFQFVEDR